MITINVIWLTIFVSLTLICSGLYFKKKALILVLFGGVLMSLIGVTALVDPISYPTLNETYSYDNGTLINVTEQISPTPINSNANLLLGWTLMLIGLACIIGSSIKLYDSKYDEDDPEQIKVFDD